jgi:hypothetical protein
MDWVVQASEEFEPELLALPSNIRIEILALAKLLQRFGPELGRPQVDS